jgi:hypothetical protein
LPSRLDRHRSFLGHTTTSLPAEYVHFWG